MPKIKDDEQAIIPSSAVEQGGAPMVVSPAMSPDDQRTAALVAATVATTLSQIGVGQQAQEAVHPEARRIAELALTVLDGCGVQLEDPLIELYDGSVVSDMMTVRAYKELLKAAGRQGVDADEVIARLNQMQADHDEAVMHAAGERGLDIGPRGDTLNMGPEEGDRKGVFK